MYYNVNNHHEVVLHEKLTVVKLLKMSPLFGTRKFITVFTTAGHMTISSTTWIWWQSHAV